MKTCQIANCPEKATRKGLCNKHYMRQYRKDHPCKDNLPAFLDALPALLKEAGIIGYIISHDDNGVTLKKLGSKLSATWHFPE